MTKLFLSEIVQFSYYRNDSNRAEARSRPLVRGDVAPSLTTGWSKKQRENRTTRLGFYIYIQLSTLLALYQGSSPEVPSYWLLLLQSSYKSTKSHTANLRLDNAVVMFLKVSLCIT